MVLILQCLGYRFYPGGMEMRLFASLLMIFSFLTVADLCEAKATKAKAKVSARQPTQVAKAKASAGRVPAAMANDPNRAVEIRGQSRTLSMMLVLKNGKDSINFIKIRKDYAAEINGTEF